LDFDELFLLLLLIFKLSFFEKSLNRSMFESNIVMFGILLEL